MWLSVVVVDRVWSTWDRASHPAVRLSDSARLPRSRGRRRQLYWDQCVHARRQVTHTDRPAATSLHTV